MIVRFDDSLPILAQAVIGNCGTSVFESGTVLRDVIGHLAFFSSIRIPDPEMDRLSQRLRSELGPYASTTRLVVNPDDFGANDVLVDKSAYFVTVLSCTVRFLDRRLVGADWLRAPAVESPPPPRFVFGSLKGGVGRSTALAVAAAEIASKGNRVLAIDLDIEAPGLGAMLLDKDTLPEFGIIDALVEDGLSSLDDRSLSDVVGPSGLSKGHGRIDVIPVLGRRSLNNSADVLAKIARAYVERPQPDGNTLTLLDRVRALVDTFSLTANYDAILVDARAGLNETAPSAITGLGAEVFLFGLNEPQTFQGYSCLLSHLSRYIRHDVLPPEWVSRITLVQGKASRVADERITFRDACRKLYESSGLYPAIVPPTNEEIEQLESFEDLDWDENLPDEAVLPDEGKVPRDPLFVLEDVRFRQFDPLHQQELLTEEVYRNSFGDFLRQLSEYLSPDRANSE